MSKGKLSEQCAFPTGAEGDPGLTKREYFAGLAMQAEIQHLEHTPSHMNRAAYVAQNALIYADALLAELEKEPKND